MIARFFRPGESSRPSIMRCPVVDGRTQMDVAWVDFDDGDEDHRSTATRLTENPMRFGTFRGPR